MLFYIFPIIVLASAGLTAYYMTRQIWLVFFGENRFHAFPKVHPHESPVIMWFPMALLAGLSLFFWFSFNPFNASGWFLTFIGQHSEAHLAWVPVVASLVTFLSIFLAYREIKTENPFNVNVPKTSASPALQRFEWLRDYSNTEYFIIPFAYHYAVSENF